MTKLFCSPRLNHPSPCLPGSFMYHELRNHPDVTINKRDNPYPWQRVEQHQNTKFMTVNKDFFNSRKNIPNQKY
ncbi:hypothetical protein BC937DRAFT_88732 [Endogone sp. FLAS-F59071]|nr:hypothetical protein BC937DRAFT_88732 [Endogone sp. FLAS-F59071]|eukprot:RUS18477.1 hypothetical protein BC937DRAFT_88732 [Endogone sp. FLAS-F59071]